MVGFESSLAVFGPYKAFQNHPAMVINQMLLSQVSAEVFFDFLVTNIDPVSKREGSYQSR